MDSKGEPTIMVRVTVSHNGASASYDVYFAPYEIISGGSDYIKVEGDFGANISQNAFINAVDGAIKTSVTVKNTTASFSITVPSNFKVVALSGAEAIEYSDVRALSETQTTTYNFVAENLKAGINTIVLKITDTSTNESRVLILTVNSQTFSLLEFILMCVIAGLLVLIILVWIIRHIHKKRQQKKLQKAQAKASLSQVYNLSENSLNKQEEEEKEEEQKQEEEYAEKQEDDEEIYPQKTTQKKPKSSVAQRLENRKANTDKKQITRKKTSEGKKSAEQKAKTTKKAVTERKLAEQQLAELKAKIQTKQKEQKKARKRTSDKAKSQTIVIDKKASKSSPSFKIEIK